MSPAYDSRPASALQTAVALSPFAGARPDPHHLLWALDLDGPLDAPALERALAAAIARHPALNSVFRWRDTRFEVHRRVQARTDFDTIEVTPETLDTAAHDFGEMPYDLQDGPLYRFRLARLGLERHVLLCGFHHLVIDGTSWRIFVRDIAAALDGRTLPPSPPGPDTACDSHAASAFWQDHVKGMGGVFELPSDGGGGGPRTGEGRHLTAVLPPSLAERLHRGATVLGVSPFRVALSVFTAFLSRLQRREDIAFGTALTGRVLTGDDAVGFHVNLSLLRLEVSETTTLRDLCAEADDQLAACVRHQAWPLREAARAFGLSRDPRLNAFTEAAFVKMPRRLALKAGDISVRERRIFLGGVDRDLCVYFQDTGETFALTWTWRPSRFGQDTVARWQILFARLLEAALDAPGQPLDRLDLVSPEDRRHLLNGLKANRHAFLERDVLHRMVEAQAARTPDRIAVVSASRSWTYDEVNAAANRLAARLTARGVRAGAFVPLLMHPSPDMLIAELAVMKSGAAFVPLSPDWPAQRIAAIAARLGSAPVLTAGLEHTAPQTHDIIDVTDDGEDGDPGNPDTATGLEDAIYCIFTSGSTGIPKGAVNRHGGVVNRLLSMTHHLGSPEGDTVLVTAAGTTDTLAWQYFWPLIHGGRCVTAPPHEVVAPAGVCRLVMRHGVTVVDFVPSVFKSLVRHLHDVEADFSTVRLAIIGGETMNPQDTRAFRTMWPQVHLINTYGATETSIGVLWHRVTDPIADRIPIGRPFDNIAAVVVDRYGDLLPQGMAGELWVGGECMGLGYLGDPAATAAKFVANPFPELDCETLYRTGDLARLRADGLFDYLGRLDDQVKIMGHRVEPGEIEAALQAHPAVAQAVVTLSAGSTLTAHLVFRDGASAPDVAGLRAAVSARLPRHMVPGTFIRVPHLPVRPGGKIDRAAITALHGEALGEKRAFAPPEGPEETAVAAAWEAVFGAGPIGRHDNFFHDLGGDSLKALIFVMQWEEKTGHRIEVSRLFEAPNVAAFARAAALDAPQGLLERQRAHLSTWREGRVAPEGFLFARNAAGTRHPLFWCCQGYEELDQLARHLAPARPVTGMRSGHLIMDYTPVAIAELAETYAAEIDRLQPDGEIMLGGNCQGAVIAHGTAAALKRRGRRIGPLILMEESDFRPHDGPVALLYGRDSELNPFNGAGDPEPIFRRAYPGGFSVVFIPGSHGRFFTPENVPGLAAAIEAVMAQAAPDRPKSQTDDSPP